MSNTKDLHTQRAEEYTGKSGDDFTRWMAEVDRVVEKKIEFSVFDLADQPFRDWFDEGINPEEAAAVAIEEDYLIYS